MKVVGVIPARWQSSRFPGKPLVDIFGKSLIRRSYENAIRCKSLHAVVIATDDQRIFDHAQEFGAKVFMTSLSCPTGTDRVWEVIERHFEDAEIVVNIQGDEPCLDPAVVDQLVSTLQEREGMVTTPITKITDVEAITNRNVVKCVFDSTGRALYFSRSPIPFGGTDHYRHLGIYCFRRETLQKYVGLEKSRLQISEDLEQLKLLDNAVPIHVCIVESQAGDVNTPEDVHALRELFLC